MRIMLRAKANPLRPVLLGPNRRMAMFDHSRTAQRGTDAALTLRKREEIVRRYWMKGDLTPLTVANELAGQQALQPA